MVQGHCLLHIQTLDAGQFNIQITRNHENKSDGSVFAMLFFMWPYLNSHLVALSSILKYPKIHSLSISSRHSFHTDLTHVKTQLVLLM